MARGKDTSKHPNRGVNRDSFIVHQEDMEEPETMSSDRLLEYGQQIAESNPGETPHKKVRNVKQAIANAQWAGDEVK
jgi:hypothetical protein